MFERYRDEAPEVCNYEDMRTFQYDLKTRFRNDVDAVGFESVLERVQRTSSRSARGQGLNGGIALLFLKRQGIIGSR